MQVKAKKASWAIGSSFSIKKTITTNLAKIEVDDDLDLIDEDTLLMEEDLKKPQLPLGQIKDSVHLLYFQFTVYLNSM